MLWLTYVALQAVDPVGLNGDLLRRPQRCGKRASSGEVVVCGRREESPYRLGPQLPSPPPALPDAQFSISEGVNAGATAEHGEIGGIPTNRAMITLKIKF